MMTKKDMPSDPIPTQQTGNELSVEHTVTAASLEDAKVTFSNAVERLFNVNEWQSLTGTLFSVFKLTDDQGNVINRKQTRINDYFRINIPGPGTQAGDGYDWVQVELIKHKSNPESSRESAMMRVRPVENPSDPAAGTAHFFNDRATSTFKVIRKGTNIKAAVYGRNEIPNTEGNMIDTIRNTTVALGAMLGGSQLQWQRLVKGILNNEKTEH